MARQSPPKSYVRLPHLHAAALSAQHSSNGLPWRAAFHSWLNMSELGEKDDTVLTSHHSDVLYM